MTEIMTSTGVFLDLSPDTEFEVTIENPMLADGRIAEPWSTDISFAPTATNKRAFGWIDALLLEPSVQEIGATIIVHGIHLWVGTLVYDGISDGKANYTFTSRDYSAEWSKKLYQLPFLGDKEYGVDYMRDVLAGTVDGVKAPLVVNRALVAEQATAEITEDDTTTTVYNNNRKYRNAFDITEPADGFIPAVTVSKILSQAFGGNAVVSDGLKGLFGSLAVLGTMWSSFLPVTKSGAYSLNIFDSFPDVTLSDFLKEICRMACAATYSHRGKFFIVGFNEIASSGNIIVWDDKVSDGFEASGTDRQGYSLSFRESSGTSSAATAKAYSLIDRLSKAGVPPSRYGSFYEYKTVEHTPSGEAYSLKWGRYAGATYEWLVDRLGDWGNYETEGGDPYDAAIDLTPAVCAPVYLMWKNSDLEYESRKGMTPIIDIPGIGASRPTYACITLIGNGQATDTGYVMGEDKIVDGYVVYGEDIDLGYSLKPEWFFEHYHKAFAGWLAKDRSTVRVDVDLSVYELAALKIWTKVSIYGRLYIISQMSVRMTAKVGSTLTVSCELISF